MAIPSMAVVTEGKSGRQAILPKVVVDCTGDADIAAFSCAEYVHGNMPITVMCRVGGVDVEKANRFRAENPEKYDELNDRLFQMRVFVRPPPEQFIGTGWSPTTRGNVVYCHWATFLDRDATRAEDLTYCEVEGRKRIMTTLSYYSRNVPGFEAAYLLDVCPQIGTRLSRIVKGKYTLTIGDLDAQRRFYDNIGTQPYRTKRMIYQIPYRCLVPTTVDNLLVAGRCISTDLQTQVHTRIIPQCVSTGQAAGAAAALAVKNAMMPRDLAGLEEAPMLQEALIRQRVNLEPRAEQESAE
ncbi:FAD-dependent oxidoreductase [Candidatus Bathyarchaeota archaeon]|nr:FAD-dependent oxidoreductase [Candidatus Bathyarchaeota archaeon]